jgi:formylglycine-generating enzyme required for sulfatase activity
MSSLDLDQPLTPAPAERPTTQMILGGVVIPALVLIGLSLLVFSILSSKSSDLIVPDNDLLLVRTAPEQNAPLIARFGEGHDFRVIGRTEDWQWLQVETWDGQSGWALRPLDILVWQIVADVKTPVPVTAPPTFERLEPEMVDIQGGTFTMGSPPGLGDPDETPARGVTLSPFSINRTEVTLGQYWQCVSEEVCEPPTVAAGLSNPHYVNDPAFDNYPVINVSWDQAAAYCNWRGERLPTEAEWEMAAGWNSSAGAKSLWPWGNGADQALANVGVNSAELPAAVGAHADDVSSSGLFDMGGNVREWVHDWYKVNYYDSAENTNPRGPTNRRGAGTGRVVRGGSFADAIEYARTANRGYDDPAYNRPMIGFRCAQDQ